MPAMANITLNNYAASPVTYTVLREDSGVAVWADVTQGSPSGFRTVTEGFERPKDPTKGVTRVRFSIARPVVNATTGLVDYISRANSEIIIPVMSSLAERQELYAEYKNFAAHANALAAIKDLEGMW
jgi:hypothetical protein